MTAVRWTPEAAADLGAIHEYVARESTRYADLVVNRLLSAVETLEQFPRSGKTVPERSREDLRELVRPPYRIVYRVLRDAVHILTIFRATRSLPQLPEL